MIPRRNLGRQQGQFRIGRSWKEMSPLESRLFCLQTQSSLRDINFNKADRNVDNDTTDNELGITAGTRSSTGGSNLD